jgi:hypothetical protein
VDFYCREAVPLYSPSRVFFIVSTLTRVGYNVRGLALGAPSSGLGLGSEAGTWLLAQRCQAKCFPLPQITAKWSARGAPPRGFAGCFPADDKGMDM